MSSAVILIIAHQDIYDRYIVGWAVHEEECETHSHDLFEAISRGRRIRFEYLHADNGHPMKGASLLSFLHALEVKVSFSRPRTSNDNPFIESLFRTLKYSRKYPLRFKSIVQAREWMADFVNWYNTEHMHSAIGYVTPEQVRTGKAQEVFRKRNEVMAEAREENPENWGSRKPVFWKHPEEVILNPEKNQKRRQQG